MIICIPSEAKLPTELQQVKLTGVDFLKRDLSRYNLTGANLSGCVLTGAILANAVLTCAAMLCLQRPSCRPSFSK